MFGKIYKMEFASIWNKAVDLPFTILLLVNSRRFDSTFDKPRVFRFLPLLFYIL
ncbi:hypothetical protein N665_1780s0004 [Sinapis alba]|nr:hypothetical protein N665_1780s0004 [Sinapis alba]